MVHREGGDADPRHHRRPPAGGVHRARGGSLLPVPPAYDVPILRSVKVHRDYHCEIGKALYCMPSAYIGTQLDARADSQLVKLFHRGQLIKTHPRQPPGGRRTDPADLPPNASGTRCGTWTGCSATPTSTVRTSASTCSGCWTTRCRGPGCGPSTDG